MASDDGTITGANLKAYYFKLSYGGSDGPGAAPELLGEGDVVTTAVWSDALKLVVPEEIGGSVGDDAPYDVFVFVEASLEGTATVRRGEVEGIEPQKTLLFNDLAANSIINALSPF